MATWLVRREGETYLEPSLGDGAFVEAVADIARAAGMRRPNWIAAELDPETALAAARRGLIEPDELRIGDFLSIPQVKVDGVIANPPYVRLRHLTPDARARATAAAEEHLGRPMLTSGSVWMPFVLRMIASIKSGGRLAVVLPLEFTYVAYSLPLWAHLGQSFGKLNVIRSRERVFPGLNQDVIILLADQRGETTDIVEFDAFETVDDMVRSTRPIHRQITVESIVSGHRAFQRALLPDGLDDVLARAADDGLTVPASNLAAFRIGYVSGDKRFFHPDAQTVKTYSLPQSSLRRSLINARKLRGQGLRTSEVAEESTDRLWVPDQELTDGERKYVRRGERDGVSLGYKASIRSPWYRVPGVKVPDAIVTVFSDRPLLLINDERWVASNSLLCAYLRSGTTDQLAASWYTPLTSLSIELEVHSLGGGVVVMVPNEAAAVRVLHPSKVSDTLDRVGASLRRGDVAAAYACGTDSLRSALGVDATELILRGAEELARWRVR